MNRLFAVLSIISLTVFVSTTLSAPVPLPNNATAPVPLDHLRVDNPSVLSTNGVWRFQVAYGYSDLGNYIPDDGNVTASTWRHDQLPDDAIDPKSDVGWCASDCRGPQWLRVDLGQPLEITGVDIDWGSAAANPFRVECANDAQAQTWKALASFPVATTTRPSGPVPIKPATGRYLRIAFAANKPNDPLAIRCAIQHLKIAVMRNGQPVFWTPSPPTTQPSPDDFAQLNFDDAKWANLQSPGNWEIAGFSRPTYNAPDDAVGLYRRWIDVPASFTRKQILWHFDGVYDGATIYVNGHRIAYHESGFTAFDMDVTNALKPGEKNLLALRVCKKTTSSELDKGDFWSLGGIYRESYLVALPTPHIEDLTVTTDLDAKYQDATLQTVVQLTGPANSLFSVAADLFAGDGSKTDLPTIVQQGQFDAQGQAAISLQSTVISPKLWSAEKPNLYYLVVRLDSGGQTSERVEQRFGFRKIEIQNGVLLFNGVPIKCTGVCRHEEWGVYGHALNEYAWRTDATMLKNANINAIRTSHYNDAARFLEICDEVGFYVLDEVPLCQTDTADPAQKPFFLQRAEETLARDKNHACVLAWSIGNENIYGPNVQVAFDYMKAHDPTHPAFISECSPTDNPRLDFADFHYPALEKVKAIAADPLRATTPAIFTEQPHIFHVAASLDYDYGCKDFWGQALANNWDVVWNTPSIVGSFIWEWQDQGLADAYPDRHGVDAQTGLRSNNNKGIVDSFRKAKPEFWNVKMVYSPVTTAAREVDASEGNWVVPLQNRYAFTDLSELTCHWEALAGEKILSSGDDQIACPPAASVDAKFAAVAGADTLRLEFDRPDGRSIYATRLHVKETPLPQAPAPPASTRPIGVTSRGQTCDISAAGCDLVIDRTTGLIRSWNIGGKDVISGGPVLNLGEQRVTAGEYGAKDYIFSSQPPELRNVSVTLKPKGDSELVSVDANVFLVESPDPIADLSYTLTIHPDADVDIVWTLTWKSATANFWELGMKFLLPSDMNRLSWWRDGLWTEYPPGHIGAIEGTVSSQDISFRSTKRDVHWAFFSDADGAGLVALNSGAPLHCRGQSDKDGITLFLSSAVSPPHDFSWHLVDDYGIHLKKGEKTSGSFSLRLAGASPTGQVSK